MAGFHDTRAAQDPAAARARIEAIYANRGLPPPANIDAWVTRVQGNPNAFDAARNWANKLSADPDFTSPGDLSPGTEPGDDPSAGPVTKPRDFRSEAAALYPWLTGQLLDLYAGFWDETGSSGAALARLRGTSAYDSVFVGNKRSDGTLRMDENQYFSEREGVAEAAAEFGFDPDKYRKQFGSLIEQGIDAREFFGAAEEAATRFHEPGGQRTGLGDQFLDQFANSGSRQAALEAVRNSSEYDNVFVGNRREDGTLRMDEPEFFAYKRGWQRTLVGFGLNPQEFEARGRFEASVRGELSVQEVGGRLQAVQDGILDNIGAVQEFYADNYGLDLTAESILGMAIDPSVQRDVLERKIGAAQVGGEASVRGFTRSIERAEELARAGIGQSQARELYSSAQRNLGGLDAVTRRFNRGGTDLTEFEESFGLGDATGQRRIERALSAEESSFSSRADVRRDGLGLAGLRQR